MSCAGPITCQGMGGAGQRRLQDIRFWKAFNLDKISCSYCCEKVTKRCRYIECEKQTWHLLKVGDLGGMLKTSSLHLLHLLQKEFDITP